MKKLLALVSVLMLVLFAAASVCVGETFFEDDFNDGIADGWTVFAGSWDVQGGVYVGQGPGVWNQIAKSVAPADPGNGYTDPGWSDYIFEGRFMFESTCKANWVENTFEIALLFRVHDMSAGLNQGQFYQIQNYNRGQFHLYKMNNGNVEGPLASYTPPDDCFVPGQWYKFKAAIDGSNFEYYIDDTLILSCSGCLENLEWSTGGIGLKTAHGSGDAYFDDIRVYTNGVTQLSCAGFEPPMGADPVTVKKNRALPHKAQLFDADGFLVTDSDIAAPPVIQVLFYSGVAQGAIDVTDQAYPVGEGTEGNQFVYTEDEKWQFNLKTKNYSASGTYKVTMESGDDSEYLIDPNCEASFVME